MISRRTLLTGLTAGILAAPPVAGGQPRKVARIGWLGGPARETAQPFVRPLLQGLRELGWAEGGNIIVEWRFAEGRAERLPDLAAELVWLRIDLIVVPSTPTVVAAKNATTTIPLVGVAGNDPVALGLVASLARPGGNITGLTSALGPEIAGQQVDLLKETAPKVSRMSVLWNPATRGNAVASREAETAARALSVELQPLEARQPSDFDGAFAGMSAKRIGALLILGDVLFLTHRRRLAELAAKPRLPALYAQREFVDDGGLMSCGQEPQGSQARRPADRAAHEVRADHRLEDRKGARAHDPAVGTGASGGQHRVRQQHASRQYHPASAFSRRRIAPQQIRSVRRTGGESGDGRSQ